MNPFKVTTPKTREENPESATNSEDRPKTQLPDKKPNVSKTISIPSSENFGFEARPDQPQEQPTPSSAPNPFASPLESTPPKKAPSAVVSEPPAPVSGSDSSSIKQLELRAIFGVNLELSHDEILERASALPGIRKLAVASEGDFSALNTLRESLSNLGFGVAPIKIYAGSGPIEFIKEGNVLLAVQVEGEFAPGVRETLMIVARELGR